MFVGEINLNRLTVSVADGHQRVWAVQSHAPDVGELRISPVETLVEVIDGQTCGRITERAYLPDHIIMECLNVGLKHFTLLSLCLW